MVRKSKDELPPKVRKRGKGYTYRYDVPITKPDGLKGRKQKDTISYPTPLEAYQAGIIIEAQLLEGIYVDEKNVLFIDWAEQAIELYAAEKKLKPGTVEGKYAHLKHARKVFAGTKLKDITPFALLKFFLSLRDDHKLGQSAINGIYSTISMIFQLAKRLKMIASDPTEDTVKPTVKQTFDDLDRLNGEIELPVYLEKEQVVELLKTIKFKAEKATTPKAAFGWRQLYRIVFLLTYTGLRIGELCALEDRRVDTKKRSLRVIGTLYVGAGGLRNFQILTPKNDPSIRTVDFSETVATVIENQRHDVKTFRLLCGSNFYSERKFLFVSYRNFPGYPLDVSNVEYTLRDALDTASLPMSITPHSLRHTFTSLSAEAGAALEDIQKQLGHSTDEMTKRVYFHVTESRRRANVDKLDNLMQGLISSLN